MWLAKLGLAIALFVIALSVSFMSPDRQTEVLETFGLGLTQRTLFALSILGLVFSSLTGIKAMVEEFVMKSD
ncbi:MAG: hypothetical protein HOP18_17170 [Deltaproteobacteria bacterium]|nr:hypothetical protein [Deltaproteobacteria bacterium]